MTTEQSQKIAAKLLKKHHQQHLLAFWQNLDQTEKQNLLKQIEKLDFAEIDDWVANLVKNPSPVIIPPDISPAPFYCLKPHDPAQEEKYARARKLGTQLIAAGKVAAFVVAGGQGTRLGFDGPKGNFHISPVKNKTLFQLSAETIVAVSKKYQTCCPWYVMTSPLNHADTTDIFSANNHYGLDPKDVFIFQQGTLPNFSFDGKILMTDKATIACSPDGHGGSLKALYQSDALEDMKKRGIEFISYYQVDNPLVNIFDPLFIGLHALDKAEMSSKGLTKTGPMEKVGNFCLINDKVTVVEYSDLPDELAEKTTNDGSLLFELGSIAIHMINTSFVEKLNAAGFSLPLHRAVKKIPHIDPQGNLVEPAKPNGIKMETFVFDALTLTSRSIILQTPRSEEFAPVKNAAGVDSVEVTKQMMVDRAADWLESAGVKIPRRSDGSVDALIEIAPGFAVEKDDVKAKLDQIPQIKPGDHLYLT